MASGARRVALSMFGSLFPPLAVLVTAPILARTLSVDGRGDLAAATAPFLLAVAIGTLGLPDAVTNVLARGSSLRLRSWLGISLALVGAGITAVLCVWVAAPVLSSGGSAGLGSLMVIATIACVPALLVALLRGRAAGLHLWGLVAAERILNGLLRIVGIVMLVLIGQLTLVTAALVTVLAPVLAGLVYVMMARRGDVAGRPDVATTGHTFKYGSKAWLSSVAGIILLRIDQLLILPLAGPAQLGLYAVAVNVSEVPLIINSATREVTFSSDASARNNDQAGLAARVTLIACTLCAVVVLAPIEWWLPLVFGSEFAAAAPIAVVATLAVLAGVPGSLAGASLGARGRPELRSVSILVACVVNVALLFFLVPWLGGAGAALATLIGNFISGNMCVFFAVRLFGYRWSDFYAIRGSDFAYLATVARRFMRR